MVSSGVVMYQITVTQTVQVTCDCCGKVASRPVEKLEDAKSRAIENGFKHNEWFLGEAYRESWHCPECYKTKFIIYAGK